MLLRNENALETYCPRRWSLVACCGLLALAVLIGGARLQVVGAPAPGSKEEPKKETPKKDAAKKAPAVFPDVDDFLKRLPPGLDPAMEKQLRKQMEEMKKRMDRMMKRLPGAGLPVFPGMPGLPGAGGMPGLPGMPGGLWIGPGGGVGRPGLGQAGMQEPRLGAHLEQPSATLVDQLELPKGQGLVVRELGPNSAGAKGGLRPHDILLELAGKTVPSTWQEFRKQLKGIKPNTPVDAVVMRKGRKETLKGLSLPEAKEQPVGPGLPGFRFPNLPGAFPGGGVGGLAIPGGGAATVSMVRNGNDFTTTCQEGGLKIVVKGTITAGKAEASEIVIHQDGMTKTYDALNKVPAQHQKTVKRLIETSGRGNVRVPVR